MQGWLPNLKQIFSKKVKAKKKLQLLGTKFKAKKESTTFGGFTLCYLLQIASNFPASDKSIKYFKKENRKEYWKPSVRGRAFA